MVEDNQTSIPHLFKCPISLDLFTDPVTLSTGQTYDRPSIEKWFAAGNLTCPVTMQRLEDASSVPNHTLRHLINQWLLCGVSNHHRNSISGDFTASLLVLRSNLRSSENPIETRLEALRKTRILSSESEMGKAQLIQLGFFPDLLHFVLQSPLDARSVELIELSLDCILNLSQSTHPNSLNILKQDAAFSSLVTLLKQGNSKIKTSLCLLLEKITTSPATQHLCILLGQSRQVFKFLAALLHTKQNTAATAAAAGAMSAICAAEENRANAIREGAVSGLVLYLSTDVRRNASTALAAVEALMGLESGRRAAMKSGAVKVLARWVFRVSFGGEESERAVGALLAVCEWSGRARVEAVAAGAVMQLLLLLQSCCSVGAKEKAVALLKLLRPLWRKEDGVGKRREI